MANPPRGNTYDGPYWHPTPGEPRLESIRKHFADLAYPVKVGPWPMNKLGPKGTIEFKNEDGSTGRLGGDDDHPSVVVKNFQIDYNIVSKAKTFVSGMGTLDQDGLVGPYTLNGLRYVTEKLGGKHWPDVVKEAKGKGFATPAKAVMPGPVKPTVAKAAMPGAFGPDAAPAGDEKTDVVEPKKKGSALPLLVGAAAVVFLMAKK